MRREGEGDRTVRLIRLPMGWWFVVTSIVAILLALVIWAIRPSPFSEWLGATGLGSGAPLSILEAWCHGRVAPLTPIGFITLFPHQATSTPTTTGERRAASGDQRGHVKRRTGTTASGDTQLELVVGAQIDVGRGVTTTNNDQQGQPRVSVEPGVLDPLEQPDPA